MMNSRVSVALLLLICTALGAPASGQEPGEPYLPNCTASTRAGTQVSVMNSPAGNGDPLSSAFLPAGAGTIDATIDVILRDLNYDPVTDYPAANVWLSTDADGPVFCTNGIADGPSNEWGEMTISGPFSSGGYSDYAGGERAVVVIDGEVLPGSVMDIYFNSPDINGDLKVDCHDTDLFESDFFGSYRYRSDFNFDGLLNVADAGLIAPRSGETCLILPDPAHCIVATATPGWASLFNVPDGSGDDLTNCFGAGGSRVDATLFVTLRNSADTPVPDVPASDLWLDFGGSNVALCDGPIVADADTDENGVTTFTGTYQAGGWTEGPIGVRLTVDGCEYDLGDVLLAFNSPDIDGSLLVDSLDSAEFAMDFGSSSYRSDFDYDGVVSFVDAALLTEHFGLGCDGSVSAVALPAVSSLNGTYPNPFNPQTTLTFELAAPAKASLAIYDVKGRLVRTLFADRAFGAGRHQETWNGRDDAGRTLPSGTYFCRLRTGDLTKSRKMSLVR